MIAINQIVRTSYGTGPYRITGFSGPHMSPSYINTLDGDDTPSEPHYDITCTHIVSGGEYYLNGYRADGTSVETDDKLFFDGLAPGSNGDMFAAA